MDVVAQRGNEGPDACLVHRRHFGGEPPPEARPHDRDGARDDVPKLVEEEVQHAINRALEG